MACRWFLVVGHTSEELKDVGVSVEALDKEGLVQAVVQQLSWCGVPKKRRCETTGENNGGDETRLE